MNKLRIFFVVLAFSSTFSISSLAQEQVEKGPKSLKGNLYFEVGAIVGSPAYFNGAIGYWFGPVGSRLSGAYLGRFLNGIQFNLGYKLWDSANTLHNLGIAAGRSQDAGCDYSYLGPVYDLNYKRFFLEIGGGKVFNVRRGDFSSLPYWVILQIGYMYRFIPTTK